MTATGELRIGSAGWNIPRDCAGDFPRGGTHLFRYARVLNCAEINSSFYRPHRQSTWERWRDSVPVGFRFAVKAPKAITHEAELRCEPGLLHDFLAQAMILGEKLGPILFQLPPSLAFERRPLNRFLKLLRRLFGGKVVMEPRHASWFSDEAGDLLSGFAVSRVAADPACVPAAAMPGGYDQLVYFRLHGSPRRYYSSYDDAFLTQLALEMLRLRRTAEVWCVFDNTASGAAARNCLTLMQKVHDATLLSTS